MGWMSGVDTTIRANDGNSKLTCTPEIVCIHTIVGYAPASAAHFSTNSAGKIWQHRDSTKQSAANFNGNKRVIAIENEDHGAVYGAWSGSNVPAFTAAQIESIANICAWANRVHGIPLVLCPNSKPGSKGIAYHRQGIDGNFGSFAYGGRVAGGEVWSTSTGKVCPGDKRISQIPQIISRARELVGLGGDDFLSALTAEEQRNLYNRIFGILRQRWYVVDPKTNVVKEVSANVEGAKPATVLDTLDGNYIVQRVWDVDDRVKVLEDTVAKLSTPQVDVDEAAIAAAVVQQINIETGKLDPAELQAAVEAALVKVNRERWAN